MPSALGIWVYLIAIERHKTELVLIGAIPFGILVLTLFADLFLIPARVRAHSERVRARAMDYFSDET